MGLGLALLLVSLAPRFLVQTPRSAFQVGSCVIRVVGWTGFGHCTDDCIKLNATVQSRVGVSVLYSGSPLKARSRMAGRRVSRRLVVAI